MTQIPKKSPVLIYKISAISVLVFIVMQCATAHGDLSESAKALQHRGHHLPRGILAKPLAKTKPGSALLPGYVI